MTQDEISVWAHETVLDAIADEIQDWMGIHEQIYDQVGDIPAQEADAIANEFVAELSSIRLDLSTEWGMTP